MGTVMRACLIYVADTDSNEFPLMPHLFRKKDKLERVIRGFLRCLEGITAIVGIVEPMDYWRCLKAVLVVLKVK